MSRRNRTFRTYDEPQKSIFLLQSLSNSKKKYLLHFFNRVVIFMEKLINRITAVAIPVGLGISLVSSSIYNGNELDVIVL